MPDKHDPYDIDIYGKDAYRCGIPLREGELKMGTRSDFSSPILPQDWESRVGVDALESLHAQRRALVHEIAPLEALFGSGGDRWTAKRRQHRDGIAKLIAASLPDGQKAPSEAWLDRMANADERHKAFCEEQEAKFPRWMWLKNELTEIDEKIANRELAIRAYCAELRLQPSGVAA
jgi:hypothetical protein